MFGNANCFFSSAFIEATLLCVCVCVRARPHAHVERKSRQGRLTERLAYPKEIEQYLNYVEFCISLYIQMYKQLPGEGQGMWFVRFTDVEGSKFVCFLRALEPGKSHWSFYPVILLLEGKRCFGAANARYLLSKARSETKTRERWIWYHLRQMMNTC